MTPAPHEARADAAEGCGCVAKVNARLVEHNTRLVTTLFGPPRVLIDTCKLRDGIRGKPKPVLASYCPFCGVAYPKEDA